MFLKLLSIIFALGFASLGSQIQVLIGSSGLLPINTALPEFAKAGVSVHDFPTLLWLGASDSTLTFWWVLGVVLSLVSLAGFYPRVLIAILLVDYLSLTVACRTFCQFQWDLLLMEAGFLALFLPSDRDRPTSHILFRLLFFKLYFESGIAKWQSNLHDWQDGSAMRFYYETSPLPGPLAYAAHHLPVWFHTLESRSVLVLELVIPFLAFGPRKARLFAFASLSLFQLVNLLTGNYGFFVYLALAIHVFLLDDRDIERAFELLRRPLRALAPALLETQRSKLQANALLGFAAVYSALSLLEGWSHFGTSGEAPLASLRALYSPFRVLNTYHLFGSITRERIEAEFQAFDGVSWKPLWLHYKPGDESRSPALIAPHQPRVDFQLWFYGLGYRGQAPGYAVTLVDRLCHEPEAVQSLFATELPKDAPAIRIQFAKYRFTSREERAATGKIWHREDIGALRAMRCDVN